MESRNLFAVNYKRDYIIGTRDRCDFSIDRIRTVRTEKFRYIRNFLTDRPLLQPQYRDKKPAVKVQRDYYKAGKMNPVQAALFSEKRIGEELYDVKNDPHQTINLVNDPNYQDALEEHREILKHWIKESDDKGQYPESKHVLKKFKKKYGKMCINPEYDSIK